MTIRSVSAGPCAAEITQAKAAHDQAHTAYVNHVDHCPILQLIGLPGRCCRELLDAADAASKRWEMAEARQTRAATAGAS